jgi:hypothetical protein
MGKVRPKFPRCFSAIEPNEFLEGHANFAISYTTRGSFIICRKGRMLTTFSQLNEPLRAILNGEWKVEHLKSALRFLELQDVPKVLPQGHTPQIFYNALGALSYLKLTIAYAQRNKWVSSQVSQLVLEQCEGIMAWALYTALLKTSSFLGLATQNDQMQSCAELVVKIADMNATAREIVLSSARALDFLIVAWSTRLEEGPKIFANRERVCRISSLLFVFVHEEEGISGILARICSSETLRVDFFNAMAFRLRLIQGMRSTGIDIEIVRSQFVKLVKCYGIFARRPFIESASRQCLRYISENLVLLQHDLSPEELAVVLQSSDIVERIFHPRRLPTLIDTGIVSLIISNLVAASQVDPSSRHRPKMEEWAHETLVILQRSCFFPRSLRAFAPTLDPFREKILSSSFGIPEVGPAWNDLLSMSDFNVECLLDAERGQLSHSPVCDCFEVRMSEKGTP